MAERMPNPKKGILKSSSSFDKDGHHDTSKQAKWDEMNILATYHPADKDYGHMKIDEPPTPYSSLNDIDGDGASGGEDAGPDREELDPQNLADRLTSPNSAKILGVEGDESSEEELHETDEERATRKVFEQKRKLHYNEFQAVKLARQLLEEEEEEDEDEEAKKPQAADNEDESTSPDNL